MLIRLTIFAALALSVSGQPNKASDQKQGDAAQGQPAIVNPVGDNKKENSQTYEPKTSSNPPAGNAPVKGSKVWFEDSNWWLVIIAGLTGAAIAWQAWLLRKTHQQVARQGISMRRQTTLLRKSADAAEQSAKAAIGAVVPTLRLSRCIFETNLSSSREMFFQQPRVTVEVKNFGQSPAFLKSYAISFTCDDLPANPVHGEEFFCDVEEFVNPGKTWILSGEVFSAGERIPEDDVALLLKWGKCLRVYGYVTYTDIFSSPIKTMTFCKVLLEMFTDPKGNLTADCENCGENPTRNPN